MKTVLYVFAGLTLLIVLAVGGGVAWISNVKLDPQGSAIRAEIPDDYGNQLRQLDQGCHGPRPYDSRLPTSGPHQASLRLHFERDDDHKEMTPLQLEKAIVNNGPEIMAIKHSCAQAYGLPVPY